MRKSLSQQSPPYDLIIGGIVVLLLLALTMSVAYLSGLLFSVQIYVILGYLLISIMVIIPLFVLYMLLKSIIRWPRFTILQKRLFPCVMIVTVLCAGGVITNLFRLLDMGFKQGVASCGGVEQLQAEVSVVLHSISSGKSAYDSVIQQGGEFPRSLWPKTFSCLNPATIVLRGWPDLHDTRIEFRWGGGFYTWGIAIGYSTFTPEDDEMRRFSQWKPGVYRWYSR